MLLLPQRTQKGGISECGAAIKVMKFGKGRDDDDDGRRRETEKEKRRPERAFYRLARVCFALSQFIRRKVRLQSRNSSAAKHQKFGTVAASFLPPVCVQYKPVSLAFALGSIPFFLSFSLSLSLSPPHTHTFQSHAIMGVSAGASKSRISRSRRKLGLQQQH